MAAQNDAAFQIYENVGVGPSDISTRESTATIHQNAGIGTPDFTTTTVTQYPLGWGLSPRANGPVRVPTSRDAVGQTYENVTT